MRYMAAVKCVLIISMVASAAVYASAQEKTEITGYYQQYRNFSFRTGFPSLDYPATRLQGGGFTIAQNLAPWFAMWTQFSFYGSIQPSDIGVRIINNQQGIRYQTKQHGPFRLYAKGGLGFSHYSFDALGGDTKFSFVYGAGAQVWMNDWLGLVLDVSHVFMGLPNLTDLPDREKWDSGLTYTTGLSIRF